MKYFITIIVISLLISCNSSNKNMTVKVKINNFQKGKVYLKKIKDTLLVSVDSVNIDGTNEFVLSDNVDSPQIYFVAISESDKYIKFFAEKGVINIYSDLKTFGFKPKIKGSKNQKLLDQYSVTNTKFNNLNLDLIKEKFDAAVLKDTAKVNKIVKKIANTQRRKYLYTINFAVNNASFEVSPYLALTEIPNVNPKLLDTIVKSMSNKVSKSLYGKKLVKLLSK